jgi:hypothetical protein
MTVIIMAPSMMTLIIMKISIMTLNIMTLSIMKLSIIMLSIMILSIIILSIMILSIMTLSKMILSIMTLSIMALSIKSLSIMYKIQHSAVITKNFVNQNSVMLSAIWPKAFTYNIFIIIPKTNIIPIIHYTKTLYQKIKIFLPEFCET